MTREQLEEIAKTKEPDLTAADMEAAVRTIAGSARAMGLEVEGLYWPSYPSVHARFVKKLRSPNSIPSMRQ